MEPGEEGRNPRSNLTTGYHSPSNHRYCDTLQGNDHVNVLSKQPFNKKFNYPKKKLKKKKSSGHKCSKKEGGSENEDTKYDVRLVSNFVTDERFRHFSVLGGADHDRGGHNEAIGRGGVRRLKLTSIIIPSKYELR